MNAKKVYPATASFESIRPWLEVHVDLRDAQIVQTIENRYNTYVLDHSLCDSVEWTLVENETGSICLMWLALSKPFELFIDTQK